MQVPFWEDLNFTLVRNEKLDFMNTFEADVLGSVV